MNKIDKAVNEIVRLSRQEVMKGKLDSVIHQILNDLLDEARKEELEKVLEMEGASVEQQILARITALRKR